MKIKPLYAVLLIAAVALLAVGVTLVFILQAPEPTQAPNQQSQGQPTLQLTTPITVVASSGIPMTDEEAEAFLASLSGEERYIAEFERSLGLLEKPTLFNFTATMLSYEWTPDNHLLTNIRISNTTTQKLLATNWTLDAIDQQGNTGEFYAGEDELRNLFPGEEITIQAEWRFGPQSHTFTITITYSAFGGGRVTYKLSRTAP